MSKMVYKVVQRYAVDADDWAFCWQRDEIAIFESRENAEEFVRQFQKPSHWYGGALGPDWLSRLVLGCGELVIEETQIIGADFDIEKVDTTGFWWLNMPED